MTPPTDLYALLGAISDQELVEAFSKEIFRRHFSGIFYAYNGPRGLHFIAVPESVLAIGLSVGDQLRMFGAHADLSIVGTERLSTDRAVGELPAHETGQA